MRSISTTKLTHSKLHCRYSLPQTPQVKYRLFCTCKAGTLVFPKRGKKYEVPQRSKNVNSFFRRKMQTLALEVSKRGSAKSYTWEGTTLGTRDRLGATQMETTWVSCWTPNWTWGRDVPLGQRGLSASGVGGSSPPLSTGEDTPGYCIQFWAPH